MIASPTRQRIHEGRYRLTRAGIFNLWQYDDQIFEFHEGRLLLRGKNGSGKTKALELLLPFLLDADLSPSRLDPAGQNVKGMKYNLLDNEQGSRLGYAWIEFGRVNDEGHEEYVTLGAGLRASQSSPSADAWYFLTTQRIGHDLKLEDGGGHALPRDRLRAALGSRGNISESATDYRSAIDEKLFGLGKERYRALIDLLIHLRRPQLSKSLDPEVLANALSESLPPLDEGMITRIADAFNELEKQQRALADVTKARDAVANFLSGYESYAKILSRTKATRVIATKTKVEAAARALDRARRRQETLSKDVDQLQREILDHKRDHEGISGTIDALRSSPEAKKAEDLQRLATFVKTLRDDANRMKREIVDATAEVKGDVQKLKSAEQELKDADEAERRLAADVQTYARIALVEATHELLSSERNRTGTLSNDVEQRWEQRTRMRANDIRALEVAAEKVKKAESDKQALEGEQSRADENYRESTEATRIARASVVDSRTASEDAAEAWRSTLKALSLGDETFDTVLSAFEESDLRQSRHIGILQGASTSQQDILIEQRREIDTERGSQAKHATQLRVDIKHWKTERDSPPTPPVWYRAERKTRIGAPFYRLVDFNDGVSPEEGARLEAALTGAGILDAWLSPEGKFDQGTLDAFLSQGVPQPGSTLAQRLHPVENSPVPIAIVRAILQTIPLCDEAPGTQEYAGIAIGGDGSWRVGPIRGRTSKAKAEFIGELAREQSRLARIAAAEKELSLVEASIADLDTQIKQKNATIQLIRSETSTFPSLASLSQAYSTLTTAVRLEEAQRDALIAVQRRVAAARDEVARQQKARRELAREKGLEDILETLAAAKENLESYRQRCNQWFRAVEGAGRARRVYDDKKEATDKKRTKLGELEGQFAKKDGEAGRNESELETLRAASGKAIAQLQKELEKASARLKEIEALKEKKAEARTQKIADQREADVQHAAAGTAVAEAERNHLDATTALGSFRTTGLIELGAGAEAPPVDDLRLAEFVNEHTRGVPEDDASLEAATNLVHPKYQILSRELSNEYSVLGVHVHDAFVVTIAHAGKESTARQMHGSLQQEAEVQGALLAKRETDLIEKHLFGEVSNHIRTHIRKAHDLVTEMNKQLEAHPTASGLRMKLNWGLQPEIGKPAERALAAIRKSQNLLTDVEKRSVTEFLQDCQKKSRDELPTATQTEQLMRALDYRQWFRFELFWKKPGQADFSRLTKKTHATGSAGEKAVALYLPLFSAASAHFDSARKTAPRLVLLDEVFAGVDSTTRGSCMGLLVAFDLDVMMTAFSEWACYREVTGIAIYNLERDANTRGVLASPFWWDGTTRRDLAPEA